MVLTRLNAILSHTHSNLSECHPSYLTGGRPIPTMKFRSHCHSYAHQRPSSHRTESLVILYTSRDDMTVTDATRMRADEYRKIDRLGFSISLHLTHAPIVILWSLRSVRDRSPHTG